MAIKFLDVNEEFISLMNTYREPVPGTPLIKACSESPVIFAEKMLGIRPYAWQVYAMTQWTEALQSRARKDNKEYIVLSSRQIGKSTAVAIFGLWAVVFNKYPYGISNNTSVGIVSASDIQARKLLNEVEKMIRIGDTFMADTYKNEKGESRYPIRTVGAKRKGFFSSLLSDTEANNTTTITFSAHKPDVNGPYLLAGSKTGSVFKSFPPTSVVLGETLSMIIIDEAGKSERIDDQFFYDYAYPTGNAANALRLYLSTPWEPTGFFYERVDPDGTLGSKSNVIAFTIDAIRLENPDYYATVKADIDDFIQKGKVDEVNRGYYCRFVKGDLSYFDPEKVRLMQEDYIMYLSYPGACDMGVDFGGKTTSRTVVTISEFAEGGVVRRLYKKVYQVGKDDGLIDDIESLLRAFNVQRIVPDNCAQGEYVIKEMVRRGWNVQPIEKGDPPSYGMSFKTWKVKKYGAFRSKLNEGKIKTFRDNDLQTEMLAMQFNNGARNSVINHAPGYTDDEIDSFVMSCFFFLEEEDGVKFYEW